MVAVVIMQMDLMALQIAGVVEMEHETRRLPGEHGLYLPGMDLDLRHVAEGMQHADAARGGEQESEHITQAQVVVDVAQQHQHQHERKGETLPRGQDVDAALVEHHRAGLDGAAERPVTEFLFECEEHVSALL